MAVKKAAVPIPRSYDAANALLREHGEIEIKLAKADTRLSAAVARLTARIEQALTPLKARQKAIEAQLEAYAAQERQKLTDDGKVKHHDMPAGRIGWRDNPPSVGWKKGFKADDILKTIAALKYRWGGSSDQAERENSIKLGGFVRIVEEPNKEAMLANKELALLIDGVRIGSSGEKFYLEPKAAKLAEGEP